MPVVLHLRYNRVNGFYSPILDLQSTTTTSSLVEVGSEKGFLSKSDLSCFPYHHLLVRKVWWVSQGFKNFVMMGLIKITKGLEKPWKAGLSSDSFSSFPHSTHGYCVQSEFQNTGYAISQCQKYWHHYIFQDVSYVNGRLQFFGEEYIVTVVVLVHNVL